MKSSVLLSKMIKESEAAEGVLELDFTNPEHYAFYVENLGGMDRLQAAAPELLERLNLQRDQALQPQTINKLNCEDGFSLRDLQLFMSPRPLNSDYEESCTLKAKAMLSLASDTEIPQVSAKSYVIDKETHNVIHNWESTLQGINNNYELAVECSNLSVTLMDRPLFISTTFSMTDQTQDGLSLSRVKVCTTTTVITSFQHHVNKVELLDPIIKHPSRSSNSDKVCVSYKRKSQMSQPDYDKNLELVSGIEDMPVYLPFTLTVSLKDGAYFKQSAESGYFKERYDPRISLYNIQHDKKVVPGCARLIQPWFMLSDKNITVLDYNKSPSGQKILEQPNKLKIAFPEDWQSKIHSNTVLDVCTTTELYGNILLNACISTKSKLTDGYVSIIAQYEYQRQDASQVKVNRILFQWGCLAGDTRMLTPTGYIAARDVKVGDSLLSADGHPVLVRNFTIGVEEMLLRISTHSNTVELTDSHTLGMVGEEGSVHSVAAGDVRPGDKIFQWDNERALMTPAEIVSIERVPYYDRVYNFQFDESTYLVGDGLMVGDLDLQRRHRLRMYDMEPCPLSSSAERMYQQMSALFLSSGKEWVEPVFCSSDMPESYAMHYFAMKCLLYYNGFPLAQAQTIAEYCQFLGDNATTGSLLLDEIPHWINALSFYQFSDEQYEVPLIPTAMAKWYDKEELANPKPWCPTASDNNSFDVIEDILRPFHFFPGESAPETTEEPDEELNERVVLCPQRLKLLLQAIADEVCAYKKDFSTLPESLMMKLGICLHILADTILHQNFGARRSWINMVYREGVYTPDGSHADKKYPPYQDFNDTAPYDAHGTYPAGLEKIGWTMNETFLKLSYQYPLSAKALGVPSVYDLWNNYAQPNYFTYSNQLHVVNDFLRSCKELSPDAAWRSSPQCEQILSNFKCTQTDFQSLAEEWQKELADMNFHYNAEAVFQKIVKCDTTKQEPLEQYSNFFDYTRILYDWQQIWKEKK